MYLQITLHHKVTFNFLKAKSKLKKRASPPEWIVDWNKTGPKIAFRSLISHVMKLINLTSSKKIKKKSITICIMKFDNIGYSQR